MDRDNTGGSEFTMVARLSAAIANFIHDVDAVRKAAIAEDVPKHTTFSQETITMYAANLKSDSAKLGILCAGTIVSAASTDIQALLNQIQVAACGLIVSIVGLCLQNNGTATLKLCVNSVVDGVASSSIALIKALEGDGKQLAPKVGLIHAACDEASSLPLTNAAMVERVLVHRIMPRLQDVLNELKDEMEADGDDGDTEVFKGITSTLLIIMDHLNKISLEWLKACSADGRALDRLAQAAGEIADVYDDLVSQVYCCREEEVEEYNPIYKESLRLIDCCTTIEEVTGVSFSLEELENEISKLSK